MSSAKDLDLLSRAECGDWQSRVDFCTRFIWNNPKVRRLAGDYQYVDDFLHDCFANVVRTGHTLVSEQDIGDWVLLVAQATALERRRIHRSLEPANGQRIRFSAAPESDEPAGRSRLSCYIPPRASSETVGGVLSELIGPTAYALIAKRTSGSSSWAAAAAATGTPLNTVGPTVVRALNRLARFFGAPPLLNDDLEPVFTWIVREDATQSGGDPLKPKGRIYAIQNDSTFYSVTSEMRSIGLSLPADARMIVLWDAAILSTEPPNDLKDHLANCHYCADVLRSLILLHQAIGRSADADFLLCPGAFTLIDSAEYENDALDRHLTQCALCGEERLQVMSAPQEKTNAKPSRGHWRSLIAGVATAALVLAGGYYAWRQYTPSAKAASTGIAAQDPEPIRRIDPRYKDLAEPIHLEDKRFLDSVLLEDTPLFQRALLYIKSGHVPSAILITADAANRDPGMRILRAVALYLQNAPAEGYNEVMKAEAMPPRDGFRCWIAMQAALQVGEMKTVERETEHLAAFKEYAARANALLAKAKARK